MIKYKVTLSNSAIEFASEQEASSFASENQTNYEAFDEELPIYDPYLAAKASIEKGREISGYMLLELNAKAKAYKQQTGIAVGAGLISLNNDLENFLNKGALDPDAIGEIQRIVATGQVDSFVDVYANALIQIEEFLEG